MKVRKLEYIEVFKGILIAIILFILLGTITSLWNNPFFIRMTPNTNIDFIMLGLESLVLGFYMGTKSNTSCDYSAKASVGGVFGFFGFGCLICNKIFLMVFGASFILGYIEPIRYYIGTAGILIMLYFLFKKLRK